MLDAIISATVLNMVSTSNYLVKPNVRVVPSAERRHVQAGWYDSHQSFVGGADGDDGRYGLLVVHNESRIAGGSGFPMHGHRDMEIVTWIFSGTMVHEDSQGNVTTIHPGLAQRMTAGSGILHSEVNPDPLQASHGVQMWVLPDKRVDPSYAEADVADRLATRQLVPIASGANPDAAITLQQPQATLWAATLSAGDTVELPESPYNHLFVGLGGLALEDEGRLEAGDAARLTDAGSRRVTAAQDGTQLLLWQMG